MNQYRNLIVLILFLISSLFPTIVTANEKTDASFFSPISFKIEMLPWEEVNKVIPKYAKFTVIDVETGANFKVQRRAGSKHADVQPLTKKDTVTMKKIYNGTWSWNRKAVLVLVNNRLIAASMHGMPHGAGALQNNFPGHFCIHFFESTTHRSSQPDLGHHLMVLKSAGVLEQYLHQIDATQMINVFMTALNNKDYNLLKTISYSKNPKNYESDLRKLLENIEIIKWKITDSSLASKHLIGETIPVKLHMYLKDKGLEKAQINIEMSRSLYNETWKIEISSLVNVCI